MKKFLLAFLFIPTLAYAQLPLCGNNARVAVANINLSAGTGNVQVIAATSEQAIYICGYILIASADSTVTFVAGTGTNCGTGTTTLETLGLTSTAGLGIAIPNTGAVQNKAPVGNALCLGRSASAALTGRITYVVQ
jgi:hypothetical protein